jgi:hypothetical protein
VAIELWPAVDYSLCGILDLFPQLGNFPIADPDFNWGGKTMRAVFISYRRDDSEGQAGRLYDDLAQHFGDGSVFMDVVGIDPGLDFRKVIDKNVSSCGVLLCLIGPTWLDAKDESGRRRLDNPLDFVRLETAAALKRDIPVVPVLVAKARMPSAEQLPDDLKELAYRNGVELTHAHWVTDVQVLVKALQRHLDNTSPVDRAPDRAAEKTTAPTETKEASTLTPQGPRPATKSWRTLVVAAVAALAIAAGLGYALYENKNASREEEVKVRQAAADASARQLAEDQKAANREAARKAAADQEAAQKAAADREAARKAAAERAPSNNSARRVHSNGRLIVRGTWHCDLDSGAETDAGADFWWEQDTSVKRYLVPQNGAGFFVVGIRDFESVKYADLERFQYSSQKIDGSSFSYNQIPQGTVVAYKTNEGRFGKFIVDEYGYNLTIRWMTFE